MTGHQAPAPGASACACLRAAATLQGRRSMWCLPTGCFGRPGTLHLVMLTLLTNVLTLLSTAATVPCCDCAVGTLLRRAVSSRSPCQRLTSSSTTPLQGTLVSGTAALQDTQASAEGFECLQVATQPAAAGRSTAKLHRNCICCRPNSRVGHSSPKL